MTCEPAGLRFSGRHPPRRRHHPGEDLAGVVTYHDRMSDAAMALDLAPLALGR